LQDGGHILSQKIKRQKGDKYHMPGQGRALDGAEGARVFHQFKEYAKPFMTLMPLTRDTKTAFEPILMMFGQICWIKI
jgi:hypothetical protein